MLPSLWQSPCSGNYFRINKKSCDEENEKRFVPRNCSFIGESINKSRLGKFESSSSIITFYEMQIQLNKPVLTTTISKLNIVCEGFI